MRQRRELLLEAKGRVRQKRGKNLREYKLTKKREGKRDSNSVFFLAYVLGNVWLLYG